MKKFQLILLLVVVATMATYAQKAKVKAAFNYYKSPYNDYEKAKVAIDDAILDEQTKTMEQTWYYRGLIYSSLFRNEKYNFLCDHCLQTAYEAYSRALEINPKNEWADEIKVVRIPWITNQIFGQASDQFKAKNYADALSLFEFLMKMNPADTSALFNAAYSAKLAGNTEKAIQYYGRLISMRYRDDRTYLDLSNAYIEVKDTSKALMTLAEGRRVFPDSLGLMLAEINIFLSTGKSKAAIAALETAIQRDPQNQTLYQALGNSYDNLANPRDANGNDLPRPDTHSEYLSKAEEAYKKVLTINPNNFETNFSLGVLYFNAAVELAKAANNLKSDDAYAKAKKQVDQKYKEAEPYLEKAFELNPNDRDAGNSLKQLYSRTGETEKYEKVKVLLGEQK